MTHFYDHIAHNYINAICDDLGMRYVGGFSADMYDLLAEKERKRLLLFAEDFFDAIDRRKPTSKNFQPMTASGFEYVPQDVQQRVDPGNKKVSILTDTRDEDTNLGRMIDRFAHVFSGQVDVIDIYAHDIKGGCLGCLQCAYDNHCAYGDKDDYIKLFNTKVKTADILVIAGSIRDRYLSSRWKQFFDRSFFNNHKPVLMGKQIGFIIAGPLSQIPNLRQALEAFNEVQQAGIVDFITDECGDSARIDALLQNMAERLVRFSGQGYTKPVSFLGLGGKKIFRDDIFGRLRFPFQADHNYYKKNGFYDFPQKKYMSRLGNSILMLLSRIPPVRKDIYTKRMIKEMIKPLQKVVDRQ